MPKYQVAMKTTVTYVAVIEAENAAEAGEFVDPPEICGQCSGAGAPDWKLEVPKEWEVIEVTRAP
jgi:hypothetical protein